MTSILVGTLLPHMQGSGRPLGFTKPYDSVFISKMASTLFVDNMLFGYVFFALTQVKGVLSKAILRAMLKLSNH